MFGVLKLGKLGASMKKAGLTPRTLFSAGEQGAWYDPSDMSTLFQDSAGTVPVTAVEQPVGLILDKSRGLVLGPELVTNGNFSNGSTGWLLSSGVSIQNQQAVFTNVTGSNNGLVAIGILSAQKRYQVTFTVVSISSGQVYVFFAGNSSPSVGAPGTYTFTLNAGSYTSNFGVVKPNSSPDVNCVIDNISVRELPGNHAFQATATSRPVLQQDASGRHYLSFDGVDDFLQTSSINFNSTDKMTVFAGVRKLSDAAIGMVVELSVASGLENLSAFNLTAPNTTGYGWRSVGTLFSDANSTGTPAPESAVLTGIGDIAADVSRLRRNGLIVANSVSDQGTGNYGNYPLFIGRRGGTEYPFNGRIYSLIVRGAQSTEQQIASAEAWVNTKTGAY